MWVCDSKYFTTSTFFNSAPETESLTQYIYILLLYPRCPEACNVS